MLGKYQLLIGRGLAAGWVEGKWGGEGTDTQHHSPLSLSLSTILTFDILESIKPALKLEDAL